MIRLIRRQNHPEIGEGTITVRGLIEADLPTDELLMRYLADAAEAVNNDPGVAGWLAQAQENADDTRLDLEELIELLEYYEGKVSRALERRGLHTEWVDRGYHIWRELN